MTDSVNMSLDEIIQQNKQIRTSRSRGRGGGTNRGRGIDRGRGGGGRGGGRGRGRGGRGRSQTRSNTPIPRQGRSRSRGPRGRSQSRSRSQSQARSRSRQRRRSVSRGRSNSRSRFTRGLTPKGRAGLEEQQSEIPPLVRTGRFNNRGGQQNRLRRSNSNPNLYGNVHSRLGITTRRGAANNVRKPLAVAKRGISKRGRGLSTGNRYSAVGLRSDQILKEQRQNLLMQNNVIRSQTFTRSRNNSFNSASQLTVSVANDFAKRRRNSFGSSSYLNRQSLAQLNNQFGGYNTRRGPGSVKSVGSNRSNRSNRSNQSNNSRRSTRSRGRGRGGNRGIGRKFVNKQVLNTKLQKEIAAIQGKTYGNNSGNDSPTGVNFTPTPAATGQSLHQRFAST
ncbi:serine/arginine repetitive matrix protein 2-like [Galleria mellonella]|uniref:Serine/arginine repetitive matrix protein 2-like n=1 Tax=Galleria mellonella TaxID=7137 RepID=A0A6J1X3P2_GALME|nr:serine/arginine repetitive matrix protein 2-like [Galleria mellonella]